MSDTVVETPLDSNAADKTPETASEWFDHNVRATFHSLIDNVTLRSESEATILHALVDDLDKDPQEIIAKLETSPIAAGSTGYVDPVLAQVLKDNSDLRRDVQELITALKEMAADSLSDREIGDIQRVETDLQTPEPVLPSPTPGQFPPPAAVSEPVTPPSVDPITPPVTPAVENPPATLGTPGIPAPVAPASGIPAAETPVETPAPTPAETVTGTPAETGTPVPAESAPETTTPAPLAPPAPETAS